MPTVAALVLSISLAASPVPVVQRVPKAFDPGWSFAPPAGAMQSRPMSRKEKIVAGALIGAGAGALVGLLPSGGEACLNQSRAACVLKGAAVGTSIGIVVGISLGR
jgi:hypothetical protein